MKRLTTLILLSAVLGAGPASAMRAHDYLDADQRSQVTLAERPAELTIPATLEPPAPADATQLPTPEQQAKAAAAAPVTSPVPEPSSVAMLACGLLLLLFAPYGRDDDVIVPESLQRPGTRL